MRLSKTRANRYRAEYLRHARSAAASRDLCALEYALKNAERYAPVSEQTKARLRKIADGKGKTRTYLLAMYDEHGNHLYSMLADLPAKEAGGKVLMDAFVRDTGRKVSLNWRYSVIPVGTTKL
jgi:hypothetical protein